MSPSERTTRARKPAPPRPGARILAALISGASVDDISMEQNMSRKRVEKSLRDELQRRWIAPASDYARLQIARLEAIGAKLNHKAAKGDLASIDRLLRIMDRLDRYHGFSKLTPAMSDEYAGSHERLMAKINGNAARLLIAPRDPS
jgi:hypothetical protein